jgi:hypothetical protein
MKHPKWIETIEATDHWEPGFWVERGWNAVARMQATSVIDTVAVNRTITSTDGRKLVPIGGIAHGAHRKRRAGGRGGARNLEGRSTGRRRPVDAGRATHAAVALDLGHLEIQLAVSVRQAHPYSPLLRREWHRPNRDAKPAGAERDHGPGQQVNDIVTSGYPRMTSEILPLG